MTDIPRPRPAPRAIGDGPAPTAVARAARDLSAEIRLHRDLVSRSRPAGAISPQTEAVLRELLAPSPRPTAG